MKHLDSLGLPTTLQSDGSFDSADSAAAFFTVLSFEPAHPWRQRSAEYFKQGQPVRSPRTDHWSGEPNRFTRDQTISVLTAGIASKKAGLGPLEATELLIKAHKKNCFVRAWNRLKNGSYERVSPDVTALSVWALELRYSFFNSPLAYPLLYICDLESLMGAIFHRLFPKNTRVVRNHMLISHACANAMPTAISKFTHRLNDYSYLAQQWTDHCEAVGEYQTGDLFKKYLSQTNT